MANVKMVTDMYNDKENKRETAANIIAIAIIFAVLQIIGMIICMLVFQNNLIMSIIVMMISNVILYRLMWNKRMLIENSYKKWYY